jgi:hypothetical protein
VNVTLFNPNAASCFRDLPSLLLSPSGSALLGQRTLSARAAGMTTHADCAEVGEVTAAAGLGLDDVIDL